MSIIPVLAPPDGTFDLTIAGGTDIDVSTALTNAGWIAGQDATVRFTANVGASATSGAAVVVNVSGSQTIKLIVQSGVRISGAGGDGGDGGPSGGAGSPGGPAMDVQTACVIENAGDIAGGGGGGAGSRTTDGGGGGGGAGNAVGQGGTHGRGGSPDGGDGTATTGGTGATGFAGAPSGGDGGDLGQAGDASNTSTGGAAGYSIDGYSLVTYSGAGTLTGATNG